MTKIRLTQRAPQTNNGRPAATVLSGAVTEKKEPDIAQKDAAPGSSGMD
jgi:hypothetical protein